jgi:integrase/recombinase XerD
MSTATLPALLERFFTERLIQQRQASAHTIACYRDAFRLLLKFAHGRLRKSPADLDLTDLDAPLISAFLNDLEHTRSISARTRNLRLTAVRSFFTFASFQEPALSAHIQRVLAIPTKRQSRSQVSFLTPLEIEAILATPDRSTWIGRRDHAMLHLTLQTGLRLSELVGLDKGALTLGTGAHVKCQGKGRKERSTPLAKHTAAVLKAWSRELSARGGRFLFPNIHGGRLSTDAVQYMVKKYVSIASRACPSLKAKTVTPHVLRHTAAMELLQAGVDTSVIALWLGHESVDTTQIYLHAHLGLKEAALAKTRPINASGRRFRPEDRLLKFLNAL